MSPLNAWLSSIIKVNFPNSFGKLIEVALFDLTSYFNTFLSESYTGVNNSIIVTPCTSCSSTIMTAFGASVAKLS
ncbi:MAG: hypothetical protein ACPKPY_09470 [Nitrososphaeraceae archaeon]